MTMLDHDQFDLHDLRARSHRFRTDDLGSLLKVRDMYQGKVEDPITLHKYLYANADPINHIDPSGHFSTTEFVVVGGIAGALIGASIGTYIGYRKSGTLWSRETLEDALIGAGAGFAIGALIGGAIGPLVGGGMPLNATASVARVGSKIIQQVAQLSFGRNRADAFKMGTWFAFGAIGGAAAGFTTPDAFDKWVTPTALVSLPATTIAATMYRFAVGRSVPGNAEATLSFLVGFNLAYFTVKNAGEIPQAYHDLPKIIRDFENAVGL